VGVDGSSPSMPTKKIKNVCAQVYITTCIVCLILWYTISIIYCRLHKKIISGILSYVNE